MKRLMLTAVAAGVLASRLCAQDGLHLAGPVVFPAGQMPAAMAVGDVNGDGNLDLIVAAHFTRDSAATLLGDGLGGFTAPISFAAGTIPTSVALADVDSDGVLDLASASGDGTWLLTGDASGVFSPTTLYPGTSVTDVALQDLNLDGHADLITCLAKPGKGRVLYLQAEIGTPFITEFTVGKAPSRLVVGDADGDGDGDVAVAASGSNSVTVMNLPSGPLLFGIPVGDQPVGIALGELNADGRPDIVTANAGSHDVSVLLGDGFAYSPADPHPAGEHPVDVILADLDGDGAMAVIVATTDVAGQNEVLHLPVARSGELLAGDAIETGGTGKARIAVADFDGDDRLDLAATLPDQGKVAIVINEALWWNHGGASSMTATLPLLIGTGSLQPDTQTSISLAGTPSGSAAFLVVGTTRVFQPFKGGTLVPEPQLIVTGLVTDGTGALELVGRWPEGIPTGVQLTLQVWTHSGDGFAVSDGISAEQP
jgi:hypothetical protein